MIDNDTYLLFANRPYINRINVNGDFFHIISVYEDQIILGIDYDYGYDTLMVPCDWALICLISFYVVMI